MGRSNKTTLEKKNPDIFGTHYKYCSSPAALVGVFRQTCLSLTTVRVSFVFYKAGSDKMHTSTTHEEQACLVDSQLAF